MSNIFLCTHKHDGGGQRSCLVTHTFQLLHWAHQEHGAVPWNQCFMSQQPSFKHSLHEERLFDLQNQNCKRFLVSSNSSSFIITASIFCSKKETREKHWMHVYLHWMRQVEGYWLTLCFVNVFSQLFAQRICQEKKYPAIKTFHLVHQFTGAKLLFLNTEKNKYILLCVQTQTCPEHRCSQRCRRRWREWGRSWGGRESTHPATHENKP